MFIASNPVTVSIKMRRIPRFAAAHMTIAGSTRFFAATINVILPGERVQVLLGVDVDAEELLELVAERQE